MVYQFAGFTLVYNQRHETYAILAVVRDVTVHKKAEEDPKDSEEKFRQLFNTMPSSATIYSAVDDSTILTRIESEFLINKSFISN